MAVRCANVVIDDQHPFLQFWHYAHPNISRYIGGL